MIKLFHGLIIRLWSKSLHLLFRVKRGLTIGVRAVVRDENGRVLLVRHTYTQGWHFPGGGVELNEAAEEALAKELRQETGLVLVGRPRLHGIFLNSAVSSRDHVLTYLCEVKGQLPSLSLSPEIAELGYFGLDGLPNDTDQGTKRRLREISEGGLPSKFW